MRHNIFKLLTLFFLFALVLSFGCGGDETASSELDYGTLTGTVTLEDAEDFSGVVVATGDQSETTDTDGFYQIDRLSPGTIEVTASFDGYIAQTQTVEVVANESVELDFDLQFENQPPIIESVTVDPDILLPTETASVIVEAYDPDGSELVFSFEATAGFAVEAGDGPGEATLIAPGEFGVEGELIITVEDALGDSVSETVLVQTRTNDDPVIESISAIPGQFEPGQTGVLSVSASDPDGDELQYQWDAPESWSLNPTDEAEVEITAPGEPNQTALIEVTVTDGLGGLTTGDITVTTRDNRAPEITALDVDPAQVAPGGEMELSVEAHDPDGDDLIYDWSAPSEWTVVDGQNSTTTLIAPEEYGVTAFIEVMVSDEYGASTSAEVVVSTITNQGPQIVSMSANPTQVERSGVISLGVDATHPQDADLYYDWDAPAGWTLIEDSDAPENPQLEAPDSPGESATIIVTVTDPSGEEAMASVMVSTFANQAPIIESLDADPSSVVPGETVTVEVSAYDPDGLGITYEWDVPSEWTGSSTTESLMLTAPDSYGVSGTVEITVSDGIDTTTASITVSTVQNVAPTISSFTANPATVERGGISSLQVVASDPYGETLSYSWEVDNDDWTLSAGDDEATIQAPDLSDDLATVTVTVDDGHGGATEASVVVNTAANSAPVISSFSASPYSLERQGTSVLQVDAYDPDGEPLSYSWEVDNGDWALSASDDEATIEAPDVSDDSATVTVTVDDGFGGTASASVTVETRANNLPVIFEFNADHTVVQRQGTSNLSVAAYDPDGDALSYEWSVDNADWSITGSGDEVELQAPDTPGDMVTVTVTVDDGYGGVATAELTVETQANQDPLITSFTSDPSDWIEQGGVANIVVEANDPDGDSLSYDWSAPSGWTVVGDGDEVELQAPAENRAQATITVTVSDPWGGSDEAEINVRTQDTEPDSFGFENQDGVEPNAPITSNEVVVNGFDGPLTAVCSDCEVSRNGGAFNTSADDFYPGDTIEIRVISGDLEETVTASVILGDTESSQWSVTTTDWEGARVFTNCSQEGKFGPSQGQCDGDYAATNLDGFVILNEGFQQWEVPSTATYEITVLGAQGGGDAAGQGARMTGEFNLTAGTVLNIVVGQQGTRRDDTYRPNHTSGGGGSFVVLDDDTPLIIAGGGGGSPSISHADTHGQISTDASNGWGNRSCGSGGTDGDGGRRYDLCGDNNDRGQPGGGFLTKGEEESAGWAGQGYLDGAAVGGDSDYEAPGGFGGGGSTGLGFDASGGGGGYSGGGAGSGTDNGNTNHRGGGGGSYNDGNNQDNAAGVNSGHGQVIIDIAP